MADDRTYIKLHDGFDEHPKVAGLSDKEFRTYIEAVCYCARNLTDGRIPFAVARKMAPPRVWAMLTASGLTEADDVDYFVHDYLEHQRSAEQVKQLKAARREAGSRGGKAKASGLASARGVASDLLKQTPSKVVPDTEAEEEELLRSSSVTDPFDEFWQHYPRKVQKQDARKAWQKALKKATASEIIDAVKAYPFGDDPTFIKYAATWLNKECWTDTPDNVRPIRRDPSDPHAGEVRWIEFGPGQYQQAHPEGVYYGKRSVWLPVGQAPA